MKLETKLKRKYQDKQLEVKEYMEALIDQLVSEYGDLNPSWELSFDMICDWYEIYVAARNSIKEKGVSWIDVNDNIRKNPDMSTISVATNTIQGILRSFAQNPYQKSKMKALNKDLSDETDYVKAIFG